MIIKYNHFFNLLNYKLRKKVSYIGIIFHLSKKTSATIKKEFK